MNARPFLMFQGNVATEAMQLYTATFPGAELGEIVRRPDGTVLKGSFRVGGLTVMTFDSDVKHGFDFTPSSSIFVDFDSEETLERVVNALSDGGKVMMPLASYGFSKKFAWVADRFGVSWQLNLP